MTEVLDDLVRNALAGMIKGPQPLVGAVQFYSQQADSKVGDIEKELARRVPSSPNDEIRKLFHSHLSAWDWETAGPWIGSTPANTGARRTRIYDLMKIGLRLRSLLNEHVPHYEGVKSTLIEDPKALGDWYTFDFRASRSFYWKRLHAYLQKSLGPHSVNALDAATTRILERLGDPASAIPHCARGLVVGYVQSGKTTNFTGLIAKGIDAGYRLVIVLSGTTNLLRNQTQRRLDKELVGVENILRGAAEDDVDHDYKADPAWPSQFITYGRQPSLLNNVDIVRLTGQKDFQVARAGINPLEFEFEKRNRHRPLYDRENLDHAGARLIVVKKQKDRLKRLLKELRAAGEAKCAEVPALVIDDESDQASVNTLRPVEPANGDPRPAINKCVVELLKRLPRAQYVGYTATPFANVFVNPNDPADIYPKDFILSLERPPDYMGARDFHDFEAPNPGRLKNEEAFVRGIPQDAADPDPKDPDRLQEAMDAFVLTGALKVFREKNGAPPFRHHTMLVHASQLQAIHGQMVQQLHSLWSMAGYDSPGPGLQRLKGLLKDFEKVWVDRGKNLGLAFPRTFEDLKSHLGTALARIRNGDPILMVNAAEGAAIPDFDKTDVWKIVVGGAKLSRGYTVEGLTISHFRRRAKTQDTLMQMGRWFGFRRGYQDLVRLYIGRAEPEGKGAPLDLYEAFGAVCKDEEDFRAQLDIYQRRPDGTPGLTPRQVPALVFNSHPRLRPTSPNKMFNAELVSAGFDYREPTSQAIKALGRKTNAKLFADLLGGQVHESAAVQGGRGRKFSLKWVDVKHKDITDLLIKLEWEQGGTPLAAEMQFLASKEVPVDSWILLAPQVEGKGGVWKVGPQEFRCIERAHPEVNRFGVFSSPDHVRFAKWLVGRGEDTFLCPGLKQRMRTGVCLIYPTQIKGGDRFDIPAMGFALVLPSYAGEKRLTFVVHDKSDPDAVVVDAPKGK